MDGKFKIALIIPYFGKWPYWKDLFMHSCRQNKDIDFYFFSDCDNPDENAEAQNIYFFSITFVDYCRMVGERLGINYHPDNPYKLCDLKPFYGYIHQDILKEGKYDFWGFADIDLVWGDIRKFCTDEILKTKDVFSTHADRVSGHFALFRNTEELRRICFNIPQWKQKLEEKKHYALDELDFTIKLYGRIIKLAWKVHSMLLKFHHLDEWAVYQRVMKVFNFFFMPRRLFFKELNTTPFPDAIQRGAVHYLYSNGRMTNVDSNAEIIYLHFLCLKKVWKEDDYYKNNKFNSVSFTVNGINFDER